MSGPEFLRDLARSLHPVQLAIIAVVAGACTWTVAFELAGALTGWTAVTVAAAAIAGFPALAVLACGSRRVQDWVRTGRLR